jgi:P-type Mg2+ transporter
VAHKNTRTPAHEFSWYTAQSVDAVLHKLGSHSATGLRSETVKERQARHGSNLLPDKTPAWWILLLRQFESPLVYLLVIIAGIAFFLEDSTNAIMILIIVMINTLLSFYQEYRAQNQLKHLKEYIVGVVQVIRDGVHQEISTADLVPGDIVILYPGDIIPADVRFIKTEDVNVDESALTGESAMVKKTNHALDEQTDSMFDAYNIGFSGTTLLSGKAVAIVCAVGERSTMGQLANLATRTVKVSGFSREIAQYSRFILIVIAITILFIFGANIALKGAQVDFLQLLLFICALGVSIIPQALPLVVTISLSQGAMRLAKNAVVVKRLSAIEDLGGIQVLCADKTGTLTENIMNIAAMNTFRSRQTTLYGLLASGLNVERMHHVRGFDKALWDQLSLDEHELLKAYEIIQEAPFTAQRRRSAVIVKHGDIYEMVVRGAVPEVLNSCTDFDGANEADLRAWFTEQGSLGRRVIAVAHKRIDEQDINDQLLHTTEYDLTLLGLIAFEDPIKETTIEAVKQIRNLGVRMKIISGDTQEVCASVAYQVGLIDYEQQIITGEEFAYIPDDKKAEVVDQYVIFARISPEQKYQIIQLLQERYEVGYVGDGINDAPPLRKADVSLAVQDAADIAREAADIILLKEDLKVIADGIQIGRETFANTLKYIKITLSSGLGNFYAIAMASLLVDFLPMLPIQILLLNLFTDFPMIALSTDTVDTYDIKKPKKYSISDIALIATILGIVSTVFDFIYFGFFYRVSPTVLHTNWFIASVLTELAFLFSIRTNRPFYKARRPSGILLILSAIVAGVTIGLPFTTLGQNFFLFTRPDIAHLALIFFIVLCYFMVTEVIKLVYYHAYEKYMTDPEQHS